MSNTDKTHESASFTSASFKSGMKIGGCFVLKELLHQTDTAVVWSASDEILSRDISLHFVPDAVFQDARATNELREEVKRNRQLVHPRILRVYDLVEDVECAAVSMDAFDARPLSALAAAQSDGHFEPEEISSWIEELCATVEDAHRAQLIHRDLAPENILIGRSGGVLLTNIGISRCVLDAMSRTASGRKDRDLAYMSPQLLDGERPAKWDDVYGLGVLIYELLAGKPPFSGDNLVSKIRKDAAPTVEEGRKARKVGGKPVPAVWDETIHACLAKSTEDRPQSAKEVASLLKLKSDGGTTVAAGATVPITIESTKTSPVKGEDPVPMKKSKSKAASEPTKPPADVPAGAAPATASEVSKTPPPTETERAPSEKGKNAESIRVPSPFSGLADANTPESSGKGGLVFALVVIAVIGAIIWMFSRPDKSSDELAETVVVEETQTPLEADPAAEPTMEPAATSAATAVAENTPAEVGVSPETMLELEPAMPETGETPPAGELALIPNQTPAANGAASQVPPEAEPIPTPMAPLEIGSLAVVSDKDLAVLRDTPEAKAAVENFSKAKQAAEAAAKEMETTVKSQADAAKAAQKAKAAFEKAQTEAGAKIKAAEAARSTLAERKSSQEKAAAEAAEAKLIAERKAKLAEEAAAALVEAEKAGKTAIETGETAQKELKRLASDLEAKRGEAQAAWANVQKTQKEHAELVAAYEAARAEIEATVAEQKMLSQKRAKEEAERIAKLRKEQEARRLKLAAQAEKARAAADAAARRAEEAMKALAEAERLQKEADEAQKAADEAEQSLMSEPAIPDASPSPEARANPLFAPEEVLADTTPLPGLSAVESPMPGESGEPLRENMSNSLGMKFVPVGDVLFSVWPTRLEDFRKFVDATGFKGSGWNSPGFKQEPSHPVVNVSWNDAMKFCDWLTSKEHNEGVLDKSEQYRLPTDKEWSDAVGLAPEKGNTPEDRDMSVADVYPWGQEWPPPAGAGNYTGSETGSDVAIVGYDDGFPWTSPVGSFNPNERGIYDLGGNVWEWCMDWWNGSETAKVLRGASWYNGALKLSLLSSCRVHHPPDSSTDNYGFRVILSKSASL